MEHCIAMESALSTVSLPEIDRGAGSSRADVRNVTHEARRAAPSPPIGNTGAQIPARSGVEIAVDHWEGTFPDDLKAQDVAAFISPEGWAEIEGGARGYRRRLVRGHCTILFEGMPGMGVHVTLSGQGCRELEAEGRVKHWSHFAEECLTLGFKASRLDLSFDDFAGLLHISQIEECARSGGVVSHFKEATPVSPINLTGGEASRSGINFGSRQSDTYVRFYDKARQAGESFHWTRCEVEFKRKRAQAVVHFILTESLKCRWAGLLNGIISFVDVSTNNRKTRCALMGWWSGFIGSLAKLHLTVAKIVRHVEEVKAWFRRSMSSVLYVLACLDETGQYMADVMSTGQAKLKPRHRLLMQQVALGYSS